MNLVNKRQPILIQNWRSRVKKTDCVIIFIFTLSLFLRWLIPATIYPLSPNDDYLGIMLSNALIHGHWLGSWSPDILSKPPAYSFFLAIAHFIPLDPTVLMHSFYLLISLLFVKSTSKFFGNLHYSNPFFIRVGFLFLAFNPAVFANDFSRIYRISLDTVATLLFITLVLRLVNFLQKIYLEGQQFSWKEQHLGSYLAIAVPLGITYSVMILTRAEGFWILIPTIPLPVAIWISSISRNGISWRLKRKYRSGLVLLNLFAISTIAFLVPIGIVSGINKSVYGVSEIENYYSGNYARAIKLWEGVRNGKSNLSFIPVSKGQRAAVYAVSPAALSLKPTLDGPPNTGWKTFNCSATKVCDESGGGWFSWELRSAAVINNHISNEVEFQRFFETLGNQISSACRNKLITCDAPGIAPGAKALSDLPFHQMIDTGIKAFDSLIRMSQATNVGHSDNGHDAIALKVWHSTIHFNYLIVNEDFNSWLGMSSTISLLKDIYEHTLPILFVVVLLSLLIPRKGTQSLSKWYLFSILGGLVCYSAVMAILEASLGFNADYALYALPMQPLLLLFILFGIARILHQFESVMKNSTGARDDISS